MKAFDAIELAHNPCGILAEKVEDRRVVTVFGLYDLNAGQPNAHAEFCCELRRNDVELDLTASKRDAV